MLLGGVAFLKVPINGSEQGLPSARQNLQMMFTSRFCKFQKQNRELSYASQEGQAGKVKQYLVDGEVPVSERNLSVTVKFGKESVQIL